MSKYCGPDTICYDTKDLNPVKPGPILKADWPTDAAHSGYTTLARRPRNAMPGEWQDNDAADREESLDELYGIGASTDY